MCPQQKIRNMYDLRRKISNNTTSNYSEIKKILSEKILLGALLAKDLHNEENLLMYAAAMGRGGWFKCIADEIREQVGGGVRAEGVCLHLVRRPTSFNT